jgi:NtrC-family two-component system sensor histidine kinase KinB
MDDLQHVRKQIANYLVTILVIENFTIIGAVWCAQKYLNLNPYIVLGSGLVIALLSSLLIASSASKLMLQPLRAIWQVILHIAPQGEISIAPLDTSTLKIGRELVTNLTGQIYQLASIAERVAASTKIENADLSHSFVANNLPLPLIVMDDTETIKFANQAVADYIGIAAHDLIGKNVYMALDMSFPNNDTFDIWLKDAKLNNATSVHSWERVRLNVRENHPMRLFDLAGYYNKDNSDQMETIMVLFDHTKQYSQDEQAVSFIALSVHELRTPLTLLRGYIEVFEDELEGKIDPQLYNFMQKMSATAQQLTSFVNNILNVARIDDDQLELQLHEEDWSHILTSAVENLTLRAKVRGITLETTIQPNLPTVGVDRLSIHEVLNNLIDNAIKYSGTSPIIKIDTHATAEGLVETTVEDFGLGIATNVMPNLFTKFYRDHRNRAQIGGTGLGLYLAKTMVSAQGGNLWVRSKEGAGSTFGFTLLPYSQLTEEAKKNGDNGIVRGAHGWIKNHSMYRR